MKTPWIAAGIVGANACHGQDGRDKTKAAAFDNRMFACSLVRLPAWPEDLRLLRASL
jgi:hypothetical protein